MPPAEIVSFPPVPPPSPTTSAVFCHWDPIPVTVAEPPPPMVLKPLETIAPPETVSLPTPAPTWLSTLLSTTSKPSAVIPYVVASPTNAHLFSDRYHMA